MPAAVEAQSIVLEAMRWVQHDHHDNKGSLLAKAAHALSLSYWQAKKLRYGEVSTIDADKRDMLRELLQKLKEDAHEHAQRLDALIDRRNILRSGEVRLADPDGPGAAGAVPEGDRGGRGGDREGA